FCALRKIKQLAGTDSHTEFARVRAFVWIYARSRNVPKMRGPVHGTDIISFPACVGAALASSEPCKSGPHTLCACARQEPVVSAAPTYEASPIRSRATKAEMEERAQFLIEYAQQHGPVTVRGLYYQAEVAGVPGIDKTEAGYVKVQRQVLDLRRS